MSPFFSWPLTFIPLLYSCSIASLLPPFRFFPTISDKAFRNWAYNNNNNNITFILDNDAGHLCWSFDQFSCAILTSFIGNENSEGGSDSVPLVHLAMFWCANIAKKQTELTKEYWYHYSCLPTLLHSPHSPHPLFCTLFPVLVFIYNSELLRHLKVNKWMKECIDIYMQLGHEINCYICRNINCFTQRSIKMRQYKTMWNSYYLVFLFYIYK